MTNEERAEELINDIIELNQMGRTKEVARKAVLAYADEIRTEAAEKVKALRDKAEVEYNSSYQLGMLRAYDNSTAVLTGKETL